MKPPRLHLRAALVVAATLSTAVCGYSVNFVADVSAGDWHGDVWNNDGVPGAADNVYIRGATAASSRHIQLNAPAGSVTAVFLGEEGKGILTINAGGSLTVTHATNGIQVGRNSTAGGQGELYINGGSLSASVTHVGAGSNAGSGFMSITNGTLNAGNMTIGGSSATTQRTGVFQINGAGSTISGGTLTVTNYGTLDFNFGATGISTLNFDSISLGETSTVLIDGAAYTGGSGTFTLLSAATSLTGYNASLFSIAGFGPAYTTELGFDADARSVVLTVTAIPEPATYALAFGALALGLVAYRRKHARS